MRSSKRLLPLGIFVTLLVAACGHSTPKRGPVRSPRSLDLKQATIYWRQQLAAQYSGDVATGDGRGCYAVRAGRYSCTAYVRLINVSSGAALDIIGTVDSTSHGTTITFQKATGDQITAWFNQTPGGAGSKY